MLQLLDKDVFSINQMTDMFVELPIIHNFDLLPATYREKHCYPGEIGFYHITLIPSHWLNMGMREYFWRKADAKNVL